MLKTLTPFIAAALLAATTAAFAQSTPPSDGKGMHQERREKMKAAHQKARSACEGKQGQEHRDCMRKETCAQAKDAAKCEAHWKERAAEYNKAYDTCRSKATAEEFHACMRDQRARAKK